MTDEDLYEALFSNAYPIHNTAPATPPPVGNIAIMWIEEPKGNVAYFFKYLRQHAFPCGEVAQIWRIVGGGEYVAHPRYFAVESNLAVDPFAPLIDVFPVSAETLYETLHDSEDAKSAYAYSLERGEKRPYFDWLADNADREVLMREQAANS